MFFYKSFSSRPGKPPRRDIFIYIQYVKCSMKYSQAGRELLFRVSKNMALALEQTLGIPADIWMNLQTQYDLDSVRIAEGNNLSETVSVTIPVNDRNLLKEIARKFGWACML